MMICDRRIPVVPLPWRIFGEIICLLGSMIFTAGAQTTTPSPTSDTNTGFLTPDVIFWIIIGISAALGVTCVLLVIFGCIVCRKKRKKKFNIHRPAPMPVHGDAIRGLFTGRHVNDPDPHTHPFTEGTRPSLTVTEDSAHTTLEMMPVTRDPRIDDEEHKEDIPIQQTRTLYENEPGQ